MSVENGGDAAVVVEHPGLVPVVRVRGIGFDDADGERLGLLEPLFRGLAVAEHEVGERGDPQGH